jgi:hypothetical protein
MDELHSINKNINTILIQEKKTRKKKTFKKEKDFSPQAYPVEVITWSESDVVAINEIKKRYFKYDYDLFYELEELINLKTGYAGIKNQHPRPAEEKKFLIELMEIAEKFKEKLENSGVKIRQKIVAASDNYDVLYAIEDNLGSFVNSCFMASLRIAKDRGGRKKGSIPKLIIDYLIPIYERATEVEATCGWSDEVSSYLGDCYYFIADLNFKILKKIGLDLGEDKAIGKNIRDALTLRTKTRKQIDRTIIEVY